MPGLKDLSKSPDFTKGHVNVGSMNTHSECNRSYLGPVTTSFEEIGEWRCPLS